MPSPFAAFSPERARRLDAYLDRLATGQGREHDIDPPLAATARRLHAAAGYAVPAPLQRSAPTWQPVRAAASTARAHPSQPARRRPAFSELASAVFLVLILAGGYVTFAAGRPAGQTDQGQNEPAVALYRTDPFRRRLVALDPMTLADLPTSQAPALATPEPLASPEPGRESSGSSSWFSCTDPVGVIRIDGVPRSTPDNQEPIAAAAGPGPAEFTVRNGATGDVLSRISASAEAAPIGMSSDCRRLVFWETDVPDPAGPMGRVTVWSVYDPRTGAHLSSYRNGVAGTDFGLFSPGVLDPAAERLFLLIYAGDTPDPSHRPDGPYETALLVVDLVAGQALGQIDLPGIRAGIWAMDPPSPADAWAHRSEWPGIAVAPDGDVVAVVRPDASAVTLVDVEGPALVREVVLAATDGTLAAAATPDADWATTLGIDGWTFESMASFAAFAADGRSVFVIGSERVTTTDDRLVTLRQSLVRVGLDGGVIETRAVDGASWLTRSVDGRSLYALDLATDAVAVREQTAFVLRRLDAETLTTEAERILPTGWTVVIL